MSQDRVIDICLVGATGYTGRIAAEFARQVNVNRLAKNKKEIRMGFCARNEASLQVVVTAYTTGNAPKTEEGDSLVRGEEDTPKAPVLSATTFVIPDMSAVTAVDNMVRQCKVICSYAGPFTYCGEPLVAACAQYSTNYIDVTAELMWMKMMELKYNDEFVKNKAKCIPCCGFDFLPNDLLMMQLKTVLSESKTLQSWGGADSMIEVTHACSQSTPMVSGGTAASACVMLKSFDNPISGLEFYLNPFALSLTEKSKQTSNLGLTALLALPENYVKPRPMTDSRECKSIEVLQSDEPPSKAAFPKISSDSALNREYCVKFCMSYLMSKYMHWSNEKQEYCFGKNLRYYGGEIRRNIVWAYIWAFMVWVGVAYTFLVSLLPLKIGAYFLPQGGPDLNPATDYFFAHLKASWAEGDVQLKWRMMGAESYRFAARGSFLTAVCLVDEDCAAPKTYGILPPSVAVGPNLLNELVDHAGLEVSSAQLRIY